MRLWLAGLSFVMTIALPAAAQAVREPSWDDKSISEWISPLNAAEARTREDAASALGKIGPSARVAVPDLTDRLKDDSPQVRFASAIALGCIGPDARASIPALVGALRDPVFFVRYWSSFALSEIGPDAKTAVPALLDALRQEDDVFARRGIIAALRRLAPESAVFASAPTDNSDSAQGDETLVRAWVDQLKSGDARKQNVAFEAVVRQNFVRR